MKDFDIPTHQSAPKTSLLLGTTVAGHGVKHFYNAAFPVLFPSIKTDLALTNAQLGNMTTLRLLIGGLFNLPAGFLADKFGSERKHILASSIALTSLCCMLLGLASSYPLLVIFASLMSGAITLWHPSAIAWLSEGFSNRKGMAIGLHGTGGSVGETLGPLVIGLLLKLFSWRPLLSVSVIPGVVAAVAIWLCLGRVEHVAMSTITIRTYFKGIGSLLRNRKLLIVLCVAACYGGAQATVMTFLPIYIEEDLGLSSTSVGFYLSAMNISGIISQPILGYLSDLWGRRSILPPSLAVLGLSLIIMSWVDAGIPFTFFLILGGAFLFPLMAIILASAVDVVSQEVQATTVSLVFGAAVIVSSAVPAVAGIIADAFTVQITFLLAGAIVLFACAVSIVTRWNLDAS
jgi:MFS family permease